MSSMLEAFKFSIRKSFIRLYVLPGEVPVLDRGDCGSYGPMIDGLPLALKSPRKIIMPFDGRESNIDLRQL